MRDNMFLMADFTIFRRGIGAGLKTGSDKWIMHDVLDSSIQGGVYFKKDVKAGLPILQSSSREAGGQRRLCGDYQGEKAIPYGEKGRDFYEKRF